MADQGEGESFDPVDGDIFDKLPVLVVFATLAVVILGSQTGLDALAGTAAGLGFVVVLPVSFIFENDLRRLFGRERDREDGPDPTNDALDQLQRMYASGELSEEEFERRTARILENENVDAVRSRVEREGSTDAVDEHRESEFER
ncbi:SHOCT domain-containing protein [Haloarchaeobius salinus]|uniref:SHOCT domain-containing protein n=1 Tax=Haloarchaeobius salinus TaxID=1198298 RepID=UPI00210BECB4|nr:SHOCT domain-containing protein [Haloarchaeobius salinus]